MRSLGDNLKQVKRIIETQEREDRETKECLEVIFRDLWGGRVVLGADTKECFVREKILVLKVLSKSVATELFIKRNQILRELKSKRPGTVIDIKII